MLIKISCINKKYVTKIEYNFEHTKPEVLICLVINARNAVRK